MNRIKVEKWAYCRSLLVPMALPSIFQIKASADELKKGLTWTVFNHRELLTENSGAIHSFFDYDSRTKEVLFNSKGFIIRIEQNPGNGIWKDAVFEVSATDDPEIWSVKLLFYGAGSRRMKTNHNKFVLTSLDGDELKFTHLFMSKESSDLKKVVKVFQSSLTTSSIT